MHSNPLLLPFFLPLYLSPSMAARPSVHYRHGRPATRVAGWDAGAGGLEGERGGESSIVGLDSTLSPLEHPLMGEPTDNHAS
ncbi:hypothetical protein PBY51_003748 [Eleginops maclovinus]|uniref:Secreted protein n=1 Tax=Eleginops maclovinus TaxID=56733 RepID=A0AAN7Y2X9_ELEMC|nr:hypothetical protein PBY51_003748 [Eleginops maclovinus]